MRTFFLSRFSKVSGLKTVGARALQVVNIDDSLYLVVANHFDSVEKTYQLE